MPSAAPPSVLVAGATACVMTVGALAAAPSGQSARPPLYKSGVDLVTLSVTVVDANGRFVTGLKVDDFEVSENGERQTITQFSSERVPVSLGIVLDTSESMRGRRIEHARQALRQFVEHLLAVDDQTFVMTFDHRVRMVSSWTSQPGGLARELDDVYPSGGTALYDALLKAVPILEVGDHAKRAAVVVTDGADTASDATMADVRASLRRSNALLYAIGIDAPQVGARDDGVNPDVLRRLTDEFGGGTEIVHESEELEAATARIADELNHQYLLGYTPTQPGDGTYRGTRVKVASPDLRARARRGYYAERVSR